MRNLQMIAMAIKFGKRIKEIPRWRFTGPSVSITKQQSVFEQIPTDVTLTHRQFWSALWTVQLKSEFFKVILRFFNACQKHATHWSLEAESNGETTREPVAHIEIETAIRINILVKHDPSSQSKALPYLNEPVQWLIYSQYLGIAFKA